MSWLSKAAKKVTSNAGRIGIGLATGGLSEAYRALKGAGPGEIPGIDYGTVEGRASANATTQKDLLQKDLDRRRSIIQGLKPGLTAANQQFGTAQQGISQDLTNRSEDALTRFGTDVAGLNAADETANAAAANVNQERAFRTLPAQQQMIRESLAAQGLSRTGAASRRLAEPVQQAARGANDFSQDLELNRLANVSRRGEAVANAGLDTRKQVAMSRMGLDSDTAKYLASIGRQDLIDEASNLAGLSQDEAGGFSDISQNLTDTLNQTDIARQQQNQAQAAAREAKRGGLIRSLTGLAGTGIGAFFGGPMGASIGGQIGQTAGGLATGQESYFDPTLLYAMNNRQNVVRSLSGGRSYNPNANPYGSRGFPASGVARAF